jgi:hypothetical protein
MLHGGGIVVGFTHYSILWSAEWIIILSTSKAQSRLHIPKFAEKVQALK